MKIFSDYPQAARFAFALQIHPGEPGASHSSMVKLALNEAGVKVPGALLDAPTLTMIGNFAQPLRDAIGNLPRYEASAWVATFSQDWPAKRAAVDILKPMFCGSLQQFAGDSNLVDRLVARHYLATRERGAGWSIESIAKDFGTGLARVTNMDTMIETLARDLIEEGVGLLAQRIILPVLEAEHA